MSDNDEVEYQLISSSSWEYGKELSQLDSDLLTLFNGGTLSSALHHSSAPQIELSSNLKSEEGNHDPVGHTGIYELGVGGSGAEMLCHSQTYSSVPYSKEKCHRCVFCHNDFETSDDLRMHMNIHTSGKRSSKFLAHAMRRMSDPGHSKEKNSKLDVDTPSSSCSSAAYGFRCVFCHKDFSTHESLTLHMKTHKATSDSFICERCGELFHHSKQLADHMKKHVATMMAKFRNKCNRHVHSTPDRTQQRERKSEVKKVQKCAYCSMVFDTTAALRGHIQTHNHKCDKCDCQFEHESDLIAHLRSHTTKRQFRCIFCHNDFTTSESLTLHMRCHTKEKKYRCTYPKCQEAFLTDLELLNHKKGHINKNACYKCEICSKTFEQSNHLLVHIRSHTVCTT